MSLSTAFAAHTTTSVAAARARRTALTRVSGRWYVRDRSTSSGENQSAAFVAVGRQIDGARPVMGRESCAPAWGAILVDAFLAANLVGGTPGGRPEDFEIKGRDVYMAFTDGVPGSDGYPDSRIFVVGKYTSAVNDTQGSGGLYRVREDSRDMAGLTFTWEKFKQGGEAGTLGGGAGFAAVDNLSFDEDGDLWGVMDMSTGAHNGFNTTYSGPTLQPGQTAIDHTTTSNSGLSNLFGIYGCNWLFVIPLKGGNAGTVIPVAYGPPRSEMTGPTFVGDHLLLAVQHPGEDSPINGDPNAGGGAASVLNRDIEILDLDGTTFVQNRTLPRGSNWPSNVPSADGGSDDPTGPPRPSVVAIRRRPRGGGPET